VILGSTPPCGGHPDYAHRAPARVGRPHLPPRAAKVTSAATTPSFRSCGAHTEPTSASGSTTGRHGPPRTGADRGPGVRGVPHERTAQAVSSDASHVHVRHVRVQMNASSSSEACTASPAVSCIDGRRRLGRNACRDDDTSLLRGKRATRGKRRAECAGAYQKHKQQLRDGDDDARESLAPILPRLSRQGHTKS
jgi:hypothetical protein